MFKWIFLIAVSCTIGACAQVPPMEIGDTAGKSKNDVAIIHQWANASIGDSIMTSWAYRIIEIDGVLTKGGSPLVKIMPGTHNIKYTCWARFSVRDLGRVEGAGEVNQDFKAGGEYYGKISKNQTAYQSERNGSITTTGGSCWWAGTTTKMPY